MARVHFRCTTWCNTKTTKIGCSYGVKKRRHRVSFSTRVNACDRLYFLITYVKDNRIQTQFCTFAMLEKLSG